MKILVDLDGCAYDFVGSLQHYLTEWEGWTPDRCPPAQSWGFHKEWGITGSEFAELCERGVRAGVIFRHGEPTIGTVSALAELRESGHEIHIVTARDFCWPNDHDRRATIDWLDEWGIAYDSITFSSDKTVVDVDVAIEDNAENFLALQKRGVISFLMDHPWNRHVDTPFRVGGWDEFVGKVRDLERFEDIAIAPVIVGVAGYAGSGKDTFGSILVDEYGFERVSFADPLRECVSRLNPIVGFGHRTGRTVRYNDALERHGYTDAKRIFPEIRNVLQRMGTEVGREFIADNLWVDLALAKLKPGGRYVFTDVRFPNEADAVRAAGGLLVRIERPGYDPVNDHPSETAVDDYQYDLRIVNDGTVDDLKEFAAHIQERMFRRG